VFIGLAEQTGAIVELGRRLLQQACATAADWWRRTRQAPYISVNLAASQIRSPGIVGEIAAILDHTGLPPHQLQLEITETVAVDTSPATRATLQALANLDIRVAIDDFGTGYANYACLGQLPLRALKLDASLTGTLSSPTIDQKNRAIIASLIDLGHTLDLTVTAEGVTSDLAALLRDMGCDHGQGYDLGGPAPAREITTAISSQDP
jgi:EAL domain-containing protein (putative c-di-GMP-specific phosphodiesterase class I)